MYLQLSSGIALLSMLYVIQTCVVRAWDCGRPLLFCPAMNTHMWEHPITATQLHTLKGFGYTEIPPISKRLACGDEGSTYDLSLK